VAQIIPFNPSQVKKVKSIPLPKNRDTFYRLPPAPEAVEVSDSRAERRRQLKADGVPTGKARKRFISGILPRMSPEMKQVLYERATRAAHNPQSLIPETIAP